MLEPWFKTTRLWADLARREDAPTAYVEACMAVLTPLLRSGTGIATDLTLHDEMHAHRVAEWMARIVGLDHLAGLSNLDLVALLLAAAAHDIGMAPRVATFNQVHDALTGGGQTPLEKAEADALETWLDDEYGGFPERLTPARARRLTTLYARHRHNDWSGAWIEQNLRPFATLAGDAVFTDDLIKLCKSHHLGLQQLRAKQFNARSGGQPVAPFNRRFCACVLRMADILDIDPARTPEVLFEHRDVDDDSVVHWLRDHYLTLTLDDWQISAFAEPPDATIHRAIDETVAAIERELRLCRTLAEEFDFERVTPAKREPAYAWRLKDRVSATVSPLNDAYVYMDGTFRPDTHKVLDLLGGLELYGNPFAAVRELIQNAFDAVREQIARERLLKPDPGDEAMAEHIRAGHRVTLKLAEADGTRTLTCTDTGGGMTRERIEDRFLVGGSSKRHEDRALERACEAHGFQVGRTAQFGIGVLSYFMVASSMELHTRRDADADDARGDGDGWRFTTRGFDDFGELRQQRRPTHGTDVILTLRDDDQGRGAGNGPDLAVYLEQTLRYLPCAFQFVDGDRLRVDLGAGWPPDREYVVNAVRRDLSQPVFRPAMESQERRSRNEARDRLDAELLDSGLRTTRSETRLGDLPGGLGRYRLTLPYFALDTGPSLVLVGPDVAEPRGRRALVPARGFRPRGSFWSSWNGVAITSDPGPNQVKERAARVEVDWCSPRAGRLAVNRDRLVLSAAGADALRQLEAEVVAFTADFARGHREVTCAYLNHRVADLVPDTTVEPVWPATDAEAGSVRWAPIVFPAADSAFGAPPREGVTLVARLNESRESAPVSAVLPLAGRPSSMRVSVWRDRSEAIPIWDRLDGRAWNGGHVRLAFPAGWARAITFRVRGAENGDANLWNAHHPLVGLLDLDVLDNPRTTTGVAFPLSSADHITSSPAAASLWVAGIARMGAWDAWRALAEQHRDFLERVHDLVPGATGGEFGLCGNSLWRWSRLSVDGVDELAPPEP